MRTAEQHVKVQAKAKTSRRKRVYLLLSLLFILSLLAYTLVVYNVYNSTYQRYLSLAQAGEQHLRIAINLLQALPMRGLDAHLVNQANQEFTTAHGNFMQVDNVLRSLPSISTSLPMYGSRLSAALYVLPLAIAASQAGQDVCAILKVLVSRFHDPLNTQNQGLTTTDLTAVDKEFFDLKTIFIQVTNEAQRLQASDLQLDPHLGKIVTSIKNNLPALQSWIDQIEHILPVLPTLLGVGKPTNYLIELLDSTELRPGGGFIGNYGIATLTGGRLTSTYITDVYLLDNAFYNAGYRIPYPPAYQWFDLPTAGWSLRDSNLDADFPTVARYGEQIYTQEGGTVPVQGVIAITPTFIRHVLDITGPIAVPEYHETVNSQNLIDRIHYYQLGPGRVGDDTPSLDGQSSVRKHFTELLAVDLLARVRQISSSSFPALLQLLMNSLHSKDIQLYLNSSIAEKLLQQYHLDAAIQSPNGDSFFVVDANIAGDKANAFITDTLNDQVIIDQNGNSTHHTTLSYAWKVNGDIYGSPLYRDYIRVYAPPRSTLLTQSGWQPHGSSNAFGHSVWAGFFTLTYGQTHTITLTWTTPGAAQKDVKGWHYHYLIQRQAGAQWMLHLQVTLPSCATITNKQGEVQSQDHSSTMLDQPLEEDLSAEIDYKYSNSWSLNCP